MEDFDCVDQFLNSPSSSDNNLKQRMPWLCHNEDQNINSYETSMVGPGFELAQDASMDFLISDSDYKMGFNPCEDEGLGCQFDTNGFVPSSSLVTYPGTGGSQSVFQSFQNVPQPSHVPPFEGVSSISHHAFGQNGIGGFGFEEGQYIDHSSNFSTSLSSKDLRNCPLPTAMTSKSNGLQSLSQTSAITQPGECDSKIIKPRVRARRGQATDPHSISERIRREKIADRMKNLQELLPNLNKTDKASTLDEIIEYVKFLQLQLKVLSTSRAGEVVPNIQDFQAKWGEGLLVPPSSGQLKSDIAFGSEEIAFERELVKLMDSNVSTAMEFLQTKGLSLMPVSLASAISPPSGAHRPASNGNGDNFMAKPGQAENIIHPIATKPKPKS